MPDLHAKRHDRFMTSYLETLEPRILNKDLPLIGKHKSNYIFPISVMVKVFVYFLFYS